MEPRHWLPILGLLFIFGVFMQVPLLIAFTSMLMVVIGLAAWWRAHSLDGVTYRRKTHYRRSFPGEKVDLTVEIENRKILPVSWLRTLDHWHNAVGPDDEEILAPTHIQGEGLLTNVFSLRWFERARRRYTLLFRKRGIYPVGPVKLESGDLFGLYEISKEVGQVDYLTVFPELLPLSELHLPADDPFGDQRSHRRLYEDPNQPIGVREYHPEDSFRRVHWPVTAHTGQLQVKVYQPAAANVLMVCLNVSTYSRHWEGTNPDLLEHLIKVSATLVSQGIEAGYRVGLIANGCLAHADQPFRIPPGRSPEQLAYLLQALAGVTPVITAPFERFLIKEVPRVPYGATLFIVTGASPVELGEALVQLRQRGRTITLLSFANEEPPLVTGIRTIHFPFASLRLESKP